MDVMLLNIHSLKISLTVEKLALDSGPRENHLAFITERKLYKDNVSLSCSISNYKKYRQVKKSGNAKKSADGGVAV